MPCSYIAISEGCSDSKLECESLAASADLYMQNNEACVDDLLKEDSQKIFQVFQK